MSPEAEKLLDAVNVVSDQVTAVHGAVDDHAAAVKDKTREAMAEAIKEAMRDKEAVSAFWSSAADVLMQYGQQQTGKLVIGGIKGVLSRLGLFLVLGLLVYSVGGWGALATAWKALWPTSQ